MGPLVVNWTLADNRSRITSRAWIETILETRLAEGVELNWEWRAVSSHMLSTDYYYKLLFSVIHLFPLLKSDSSHQGFFLFCYFWCHRVARMYTLSHVMYTRHSFILRLVFYAALISRGLKKFPFLKERVLQTENVCMSAQPIRTQHFWISLGMQIYARKLIEVR